MKLQGEQRCQGGQQAGPGLLRGWRMEDEDGAGAQQRCFPLPICSRLQVLTPASPHFNSGKHCKPDLIIASQAQSFLKKK